MTEAQALLQIHLLELGIDTLSEYQFDCNRRWRFDLADPSQRLAFEVDGGMFRGGHRRGYALEKDYEKQNAAILGGWRIIRFTNRSVLSGEALAWLKTNL